MIESNEKKILNFFLTDLSVLLLLLLFKLIFLHSFGVFFSPTHTIQINIRKFSKRNKNDNDLPNEKNYYFTTELSNLKWMFFFLFLGNSAHKPKWFFFRYLISCIGCNIFSGFFHSFLFIDREREREIAPKSKWEKERENPYIAVILQKCLYVHKCCVWVGVMPDERMAPKIIILKTKKKIMYHLYIKQNISEKIVRKNIFLLLDSLDHIILFHPIKFFPTISCVWTFQTEYKHTHQHIILQWQFYEELYSI